MPEKVVPLPEATPSKGKKKRRHLLGSGDRDDEDAHISQIIKEHAFAFFIQQGGNEEDWEETREQSVREEMLRRWRDTEWGAILGRQRQSKEPKAKRWIGGSFEIGDILGVNILQEPAESIRERMSNRSTRSSRRPGASSSHLPSSSNEGNAMFLTPDDRVTSFFAPEPASGSILRPTLSAGIAEEEGRRAQSDIGTRPTLEISTTNKVKSDSQVPVIGKERERLVHYAQSPVRGGGQPGAAIRGGGVMRDRMLVRVGYTERMGLSILFNGGTNQSISMNLIMFLHVKTKLSLYSFVDLTWCLTCTPTSIHHDSKARAIFRRAKEGTNIFICKVKSRSRAADWMWAIWRRLGGLLPPTLEISHPNLGTRVTMELPGVESPEMFTRDNIISLCTQSLRRVKDWRDLIELQVSEGKELELAWRLGTQLDWVWLDTDVLDEPRDCAVLCGLAMQQSVPSPHLEVRLAQHSAQHFVLKNGTRVPEPPSIEGYLERIRPNSQTKHLMYLVTHDGNLFSLASEKAHPPSPMGIGQAESADALRLAEVQRGTEQILSATGPVVPASHDTQDMGDDQSYVSHASHLERSESDDEDEGGEEGLRVAQDKAHLRMKRSFELLLKNGHIIRFEAHSRKVALEWIERLRALVGYWKQRHRIDASEEMDLAQAYRPRLTTRRHVLRNDSELAPEPPVDTSAPMPALSNLYSWCVLQGCKPVIRGGKVFMRRGLYGQYKFVQLFLLPGHLVQFRITPGSSLHLAINQNINLADAYVCSGYFATLNLPNSEHTSDNALPRRYQDGLETDDPDEETLFMLWYHPQKTAVNVALEVPQAEEADAQKKQADNSTSPRVPSLSSKRNDARIKKWDRASDIPLDEEDEFHASHEVFGLDLDDDEEVEDDEDAEDDDEEAPVAKPKSSKAKSKKAKAKAKASSSEDDSDEDEAWGRGRSAYYSSNAAQLDSDDEEGNELEEQEAKRLQAKSRDAMGDTDFGLDDEVEAAIAIDVPEDSAPVEEPVPQDPKSLIRHLEKTSPETLALARDWEDTAESLVKTRQKIATLEASDPDSLSLGMIHLHYQALLSYATALAFYLHLRSSEKYARRPDLLRTHPVLARLLTLKQSLITLEELDFAASDSEAGSNEDGSDADLMLDAEQLWKLNRMEGLDKDELEDLLKDADLPEQEVEVRPKKKRKTSTTTPAVPVFDLIEPEFTSSTSAQRRTDSSTDAYGEATALQHADAADKSARRKTLRFHTSRIESASARRQGARNNAVGGDDDIPYRDTRKQPAKVPQSSRGQGGEDLDESEPQPKAPDPDAEDADGYYELVKRKSKLKKELKKAEYDAAQDAARPDFEEGGADGPRSLTRAILTNKGLTPRRPKSAVYKGGLAETGRYDGEKSGISKVIKSVRLG
ncbi:hypothetical protein MVEN_00403100 [Mycena venus]|uniref:PH domain-containing protein n=1 Tax=Mycena venus TaxID=2733690 RepID=A0A8H6YV05_9AGAR|nr:hypothetical protein MVEN_00403100 [Mycena venus]